MFFTRDKSFYKTLVTLAIPIALQNAVTFAVGLADNVMIGTLGDSAISGVYVGSQLQTLLQMFIGGIEGAILILAAQYWGKRDTKSIRRIAAIGVRFALLIGLVITVTAFLLPSQIVSLFTSDASVIESGTVYVRVVSLSYIFFCISQVMVATMRAVETAKIGLYVSFVTLIVNVICNYILIFGKFGMPEMGIKGAAVASVMAEAASLAFFLIYTYAKVDFKKFGLNHWQKIDFSLLGKILSISCFTMIQYFLAMATWFVFFIAIERLGQRELAIANIVRSIYIVMLIPVQALSTTTNSLVSNLIGAGGITHVMRLIWRIARMSFLIMVVCVAVVVLFPHAMLSVYTNEPALLVESVPSLYVIAGAMIIASVANIYFNAISGTGNTQAALILEMGTLVFYALYILWIGIVVKAPVSVCFSIEVVYYSLLLLSSIIYLKKAKWQNKKI